MMALAAKSSPSVELPSSARLDQKQIRDEGIDQAGQRRDIGDPGNVKNRRDRLAHQVNRQSARSTAGAREPSAWNAQATRQQKHDAGD